MNYELLWISLTAISSWALVAITFYLVREQIKVAGMIWKFIFRQILKKNFKVN